MVGNSLVLFLSMALWSQDIVFLVGSAGTSVFLAASGGFVPFPSMESWIKWLQWISPIKYSLQAFGLTLFKGTNTSAILVALELDTPSSISANMGVLVGCFVTLGIFTMAALSRQKEVR